MPQINVAKLFMLTLRSPDSLIIINQSDCFGITLLNFAVIKLCLRFGVVCTQYGWLPPDCPKAFRNLLTFESKESVEISHLSNSLQSNEFGTETAASFQSNSVVHCVCRLHVPAGVKGSSLKVPRTFTVHCNNNQKYGQINKKRKQVVKYIKWPVYGYLSQRILLD